MLVAIGAVWVAGLPISESRTTGSRSGPWWPPPRSGPRSDSTGRVYLYLAGRFGVHLNEVFSAQSIEDHKGFLRMHMRPDGAVTCTRSRSRRCATSGTGRAATATGRPLGRAGAATGARLAEPPVTIRREVVACDRDTHPTHPTTRADHRTEVVPLAALDGRPLTLVHVQGRQRTDPGSGPRRPRGGRAGRALPPALPRTFVDALLDDGWDVWLLNWRASIDLDPVPWTLDEAAAYDHPAAVRHVLAATGADTLKAVVHCQGSTSFTMAAVAGLLPEVDTVVSNAVSLHPVVPRFSTFKIGRVSPLVGRVLPHVSPAWGDKPAGALLAGPGAVRPGDPPRVPEHGLPHGQLHLRHRLARPVVAREPRRGDARLDPRRVRRGALHLLPPDGPQHPGRAPRAGQDPPGLPSSYVDGPPRTDARFVFLAGEDNRCFLAESQQRSFEFFARHRPGKDALHRIRGYGHLDVFLGRRAAEDTFPLILEELAR